MSDRQQLVRGVAAKFAKASGYQLVEDGVNQWVPAVEALVDVVLFLATEKGAATELTPTVEPDV